MNNGARITVLHRGVPRRANFLRRDTRGRFTYQVFQTEEQGTATTASLGTRWLLGWGDEITAELRSVSALGKWS